MGDYYRDIVIAVCVIFLFSTVCVAQANLTVSQTMGGEGYVPDGNKYVPGKEILIEIRFEYNGSERVTALGLVTEVPYYCEFVSVVSGFFPPVSPSPGTRERFEFAWIYIPSFPFSFSFKMKVDESYTLPLTINTYGMYRTDGPNITTPPDVVELTCECALEDGEGTGGGVEEGEEMGTDGIFEGGVIVEGEGFEEGVMEGVLEGEIEGEGGGYWFDPCDIGGCEVVGCNTGEVYSSFESDLRWLYEFSGENPDVADLDGNGVLDVVQAWILDEVLSRWDMGIYCCVVNSYLRNLEEARAYADEIAMAQPVVFLLIDRVKFERVVAGIMTVGERSTVEMLVGMIDSLPLEIPKPDISLFDVSSSRWLSMYGDADMDGVCNLGEYRYALLSGEREEGYKRRVLDASEVEDGGGCVWCGEGESPYEGEGVWEGIFEGEGTAEGEGTVEGEVGTASLSVVIEPEEAIMAGAQWQIEGDSEWRNSGETVTGLSAGVYRVFFYQPQGWVIQRYLEVGEDFLDVELSDGENKVVSENFVQVGELKVKIFPPEAVKKGAKWRIRDVTDWKSSEDVIVVRVGWVDIEYSEVEGYIRPQVSKVYIPFGSRLVVDISYQKLVALTDKEKRNFALLVWATFSHCDIDGDGYLTYDEIVERYPQISIDLLIEIDIDKDGKISREELGNYLRKITGVKCGCIR